ncbi:STAS domain-containing protein [Streptomyces minutiscleroticus]|uniref:STAS domain-containing protein n=1 Tax=Streptomyces minutiscleroticus TaxID=68238 RepID=UPI00332AE755
MADTRRSTGTQHLSFTRTTTSDGITVLRLRGEIDHHTVAPLHQALTVQDTTSAPRTVVDLKEVTFMDSTGLNALIAGHRATLDTPGWIRLADAQPPVLRVIQITGLDTFIDYHPTLGQALTA